MIDMLLARIVVASGQHKTDWPTDMWRIERVQNVHEIHAIGWHALDLGKRLDRVRSILLDAAAHSEVERLTWAASGLALDRDAIIESAMRWQETGDPPILDLIHLDPDARDALGRRGIVSRGLAEIAGFEIEAVWSDDMLRDQTILVARMIANVLSAGMPQVGQVEDPRGRTRVFDRRENGYFTANPVLSFDLPNED